MAHRMEKCVLIIKILSENENEYIKLKLNSRLRAYTLNWIIVPPKPFQWQPSWLLLTVGAPPRSGQQN